jgi:DNA mismatch endonuclease (patch repair protein)
MTDIVTPAKRSEMMAGIKGKNTKPEILVRKLLFKHGYRYRTASKHLPGKPDIVLPKHNAVIFIHGCFWHGHELCNLFRLPKSRKEFWSKKISGNIIRDEISIAKLQEDGWRVCTVWECALKGRNRQKEEKVIRSLVDWIESDTPRKTIRGSKNLPGQRR